MNIKQMAGNHYLTIPNHQAHDLHLMMFVIRSTAKVQLQKQGRTAQQASGLKSNKIFRKICYLSLFLAYNSFTESSDANQRYGTTRTEFKRILHSCYILHFIREEACTHFLGGIPAYLIFDIAESRGKNQLSGIQKVRNLESSPDPEEMKSTINQEIKK